MLLVMVALTAVLLGIAGALVYLLQRPMTAVPGDVTQDATLAAAGEWRAQALAAGLSAEQARTAVDRLDVNAICSAAKHLATSSGMTVLDCRLEATGLIVVPASGESMGAVLSDASTGCLSVQTSWQETLPARCPDQADLQG
jgi:hypothetical protein